MRSSAAVRCLEGGCGSAGTMLWRCMSSGRNSGVGGPPVVDDWGALRLLLPPAGKDDDWASCEAEEGWARLGLGLGLGWAWLVWAAGMGGSG